MDGVTVRLGRNAQQVGLAQHESAQACRNARGEEASAAGRKPGERSPHQRGFARVRDVGDGTATLATMSARISDAVRREICASALMSNRCVNTG